MTDIKLPTGRTVRANCGIVGLDDGTGPDGFRVTEGYDGRLDYPAPDDQESGPGDLTAADMRALADIMVERWTRFRATLGELPERPAAKRPVINLADVDTGASPEFRDLAGWLDRSVKAAVALKMALDEAVVRRMLAKWSPEWGEPALAYTRDGLAGLCAADAKIGVECPIRVTAASVQETK